MRGLGARRGEPHALRGGHQPLQRLGEFQLVPVLAGEELAFGERCADAREQFRMRMAEDAGALRQREIDELVAVDVPDPRSRGAFDRTSDAAR